MDWLTFLAGAWCGAIVYSLLIALMAWRMERAFLAKAGERHG